MEPEELNEELIDNPSGEESRELADRQLDKIAGGSELPEKGVEGTCPKSPNGGDHEWVLVTSWPDGRFTGETWRCRRCRKLYNRFV